VKAKYVIEKNIPVAPRKGNSGPREGGLVWTCLKMVPGDSIVISQGQLSTAAQMRRHCPQYRWLTRSQDNGTVRLHCEAAKPVKMVLAKKAPAKKPAREAK
jgi:hypothetical protein